MKHQDVRLFQPYHYNPPKWGMLYAEASGREGQVCVTHEKLHRSHVVMFSDGATFTVPSCDLTPLQGYSYAKEPPCVIYYASQDRKPGPPEGIPPAKFPTAAQMFAALRKTENP